MANIVKRVTLYPPTGPALHLSAEKVELSGTLLRVYLGSDTTIETTLPYTVEHIEQGRVSPLDPTMQPGARNQR